MLGCKKQYQAIAIAIAVAFLSAGHASAESASPLTCEDSFSLIGPSLDTSRSRVRRRFQANELLTPSEVEVFLPGLPRGSMARKFEVEMAREFKLSLEDSVSLSRNFNNDLTTDLSLGFLGNGVSVEITKYPINLPNAFLWGLDNLTPGTIGSDELIKLRNKAEAILVVREKTKMRLQMKKGKLQRKGASVTFRGKISPEVATRMKDYGIDASETVDGRTKIVYSRAPTAEDLGRLVAKINAVVNSGSFSPEYVAAYAHQEIAIFHGFRDGNGRTGRLMAQVLYKKLTGTSAVFPDTFHRELEYSAEELSETFSRALGKSDSKNFRPPNFGAMKAKHQFSFSPITVLFPDAISAPPQRRGNVPLPKLVFATDRNTDKLIGFETDLLPDEITLGRGTFFYGKPAKDDADLFKKLKILFQFGRSNRGEATFDLKQHQRSTMEGKKTGLFSTSPDFPVAANFGFGHGQKGLPGADTPGMVVVIDGKKAPGIDFGKFFDFAEAHAPEGVDLSVFKFSLETEFGFTGIDPRQIRGAWIRRSRTIGEEPVRLEYVANPNYEPEHVSSGY